MFRPSTLNAISTQFSINLLFAWSQFSFFDEQMNRFIFRYEINEIGKTQDKSIKKTSLSSISTNWSIQSISINSDLPIFIDLSIDKSIRWVNSAIYNWILIIKSVYNNEQYIDLARAKSEALVNNTPNKQKLNRVMLNGDDNENDFNTNRSN